jgi:hypothetical protein
MFGKQGEYQHKNVDTKLEVVAPLQIIWRCMLRINLTQQKINFPVLQLYFLPGPGSRIDRFYDPDISLAFFAWNLHGLIIDDRQAVVVHLFGLLPGNIIGKINFA